MAQATSISSVGNSDPIILNPVSKSTTVQLTAPSGSADSTVTIQYTLDDPTAVPAPTISWASLSSAIVSSAAIAAGATYTVLSPLGGLRITLTSTGTPSGTVTLKALQAVTA